VVESRNFEIDPEDANDVVGALKAARFKKFIIVEDFHYLAEEVQHPLAVDLKVFHENSNLVFIIVGVWLEADRLSVYNGDLSERISTSISMIGNKKSCPSDEVELPIGQPALHHCSQPSKTRSCEAAR
jgi:hypothetical protein